jgi:hypothetical protein
MAESSAPAVVFVDDQVKSKISEDALNELRLQFQVEIMEVPGCYLITSDNAFSKN